MSGKPPRRPRVAWVDSWATPIDESSYITPEDEEEEEVAVPRGPFDDLEVYVLEEEAVRTIDEFVKTWMEIPQGEEQKMKFLESICSVCTTARESGLSGGFADFCNRCNLCRHLQRLIEKEPLDQLETAVREQAMLAVAALSSLQVISEDSMQRLLTACFRSVFMLPPKEKLSAHNFVMTMHAMDSMLQLLLLSPPTTSFPSKLQSIVKALLRFCTSTSALPRRRAMMRLHKIGDFLGKCSSLEPFGRYLLEQQRTDLMLTCLEVVSHEVPEEDEQWVSFLLNAAREDPISWFASVPHFVIFFRKKLVEELTPAVRQKLLEVLVLMTRCYPHSVTMSILFICPSRLRSSMEMWEEIFSTPGMPKKLLNEICMLLRDNTIRAHFGMTEDYEILQLGLMQTLSPEDPIPAVLQDVECLKRCIRNTNFHLLWIALKGLAAMLERPKMGLTGIILLPDVLKTLRFGNPHITAAALAVCCRVLRALMKKSASITSLRLVDLLTPYLDNEADMVRENAMKLFSACMERVLWKHRRKMWKKVHNVLLTLYLRMSEENPSVAKGSRQNITGTRVKRKCTK
eukprot:XP_027311717.1 uncharacterized protein LOC113843461 isoform X4 [Anas platyrhynchos]